MIPVCHPVPHGLRSLSLRVTQNGLRKPLPRKHIYLYLPPKTPHPPARAAEYLIRYLVVHPHVKERLIPPALLFYLFRYDFLIPKDFRLPTPAMPHPKTPHPGASPPGHRTRRVGSSAPSCTSSSPAPAASGRLPRCLSRFSALPLWFPSVYFFIHIQSQFPCLYKGFACELRLLRDSPVFPTGNFFENPSIVFFSDPLYTVTIPV